MISGAIAKCALLFTIPPFMQGITCLSRFIKGGGRCSGCLCVQLNKIIPFAISYIPQCSNNEMLSATTMGATSTSMPLLSHMESPRSRAKTSPNESFGE